MKHVTLVCFILTFTIPMTCFNVREKKKYATQHFVMRCSYLSPTCL